MHVGACGDVPALVFQKKLSIEVPNYMRCMYFVFLYCAIYLGEVRDFFYLVPNWDIYLHTFSGAMLGALGFSLVSILNEEKSVPMQLSPGFVAFLHSVLPWPAVLFGRSMNSWWMVCSA